MFGIPINRIALGNFHDFAQIHDGYPVADMLDHPQVMRDKQVGQMHLLLQLLQEIDDLRLNRNVQRRYRFIADDKLGTDTERAGDADTLALTAAELMRVTTIMVLAQTDLTKQFDDPISFGPALGDFVNLQAFADDITDAHARIERRIRVLENNLHLPPHIAQLALRHGQ